MNTAPLASVARPDSAPPRALTTTDLECFLQASEAHLPPLEVVPQSPLFHARLRGRGLHRSHLIKLASSPVWVTRTPRLAGLSGGDHTFKLVWQLHGEAVMEQGGRSIRLSPGKMTVYRLSTPYRLQTFGDYRALMLSIDLAELPEWRRLAEGCQGQALPWDAGAHASLAVLRSQLSWQGGPPVGQVEDAALELVFGSFWRHQRQQLQCAPLPSERITKARRVILERIADPSLAPEDLASALNVSMRGLYDEFRRHGMVPPAAFIRELRLEQCYLMLLDSAQRRCSITHIALEHGFIDSAHFAKVFRERYGVSPGELRKREGGLQD
ncbi:helix-turn-helix domain-containing protein [Halomonas sp. ML-15]|uniref:helix-turn-helix domain-containing protein n=1 Tax=Halomonas sp. ML-15 TaxID=2773305 RepID=UPI0017463792|nr:helix-turn-helix domain-containing protein [Halomonas sp. ML-15]MBD3896769.1 helix-turn-helix domain-containing protein [Halomonas sp. ML-15]